MNRIVAGVLTNERNEILLLHRTPQRRSCPDKWHVMTGTIEEGEGPETCFRREIEEELNITELQIIKTGLIIDDQTEGKTWEVNTFLCKTNQLIDVDPREHDNHAWVKLEDIKKYNTIPGLKFTLGAVGITVPYK